MSAPTLLSELRRRDIEVRAIGSELRCSAPSGALTKELLEELRRHKTELVALLASAQELAGQARAVVPLQASGNRTSVFAVPGHNGDVFCYRALARCLGTDHPFFGLQPPGVDGQEEPLERVEDLAAYFAGQIRMFRPQGPYIIAGFCAGGTIAFELAQQLSAAGAEIHFVALFGSPYPEYFERRTHLWQRLTREGERLALHAEALLSRSWRERYGYLRAQLRELRARRAEERAAARDPVLAARAKVENATLRAVRRYTPRRFGGEVKLFLPGSQWLGSGVEALRWRELAAQAEVHRGPESSSGTDMLREPHVASFAALMCRSCESVQ